MFLPKSAELIENKGVEFFVGAKMRKRVRKDVKGKDLDTVASDEYRVASSRLGIVGIHPAVFVRVANKGLAGYGK